MIFDRKLTFHFNNNVVANNNTVCDDYLDMQNNAHNVGHGRAIRAYAVVTSNFNNAANSAATVTAALQDSDNGTTWNNVVSGPTVAVANATVGKVLMDMDIPRNGDVASSIRRYVRIAFVVANNMTAGKATSAFIL